MIEANKQAIYRVLIVDENAAMREMLAELLRAPNRSVEVRDGARAALEFVQHNPIDVAFVDAALTSSSAQHLADTIKKRCPHAHVVVCAGRLSQPWDDAGRSKKGESALRQPYNFGEALQLADSCTTE
ncbi:MAG: response regulator [Verrucomicrobiia bacterium]|jgi:CheY-like chemotaxis protein